jgi:long-chain acyl-CoA synthetase
MFRPWLAHYDPWTPPAVGYPDAPLTAILDRAYAEVPDAPATRFLGATLTFRDIKRRSDALAASLLSRGLRAGDRVGIMLPTCPQYMIATFAALRAGAIVVNINPKYTARELADIARDSQLRVLVTLAHLAATVQDARAGTPIDMLVVTTLDEYSSAAASPPRVDDARAFTELCAGAGEMQAAGVRADDIAVLQYTGGTTGAPRAAMLTHRNIFANVLQTEAFTERSRTRGEGRFLVVLPYAHIFGFTVGMMKATWMGALQILVPGFTPDAVLEAVRADAPTYFPAVPTIWSALVSHPAAAAAGLERIGICTSGAAPLPPEVADRFEALTGRPLFQGFGLTEASPVTHSTPQLAAPRRGTVGLPMPDTDIAIVDLDTGTRTLGPGEPGELCIAGPQVMKGYWNRPEETAAVLRRHADGRVWLHTGDIATIDPDGYTTIVQRKKDVIIVGGLNVFPSEVEAVLRAHAHVGAAAVFGEPESYRGEVVRACVVLREGSNTTPDALIAHCREQLAPYKVPVHVDIRGDLPTSAVGKVLYRVLRSER